jgi:hypothetical protein
VNDYIFLMHNDAAAAERRLEWGPYLAKLRASGAFSGGSSIGAGICVKKAGTPADITGHLAGYLRVQADDLESARRLVEGNPVFEAGGTVEIRELPRD